MATLTVWQFDTADGAADFASQLDRLAGSDASGVDDGALVEWPVDARRPRTTQLACVDGDASLDAGFWGLLFGIVFFVPLLGAAMGDTTGALSGALADVGIDDHFINRLRDQVTPGTSALVLMTPAPVAQQVEAGLVGGPRPEPITTVLDDHQEAALRAVYGG